MRRVYLRRKRLSPLPHIGEVPRPTPWNDEHRVDPNLVAVAHVARRQPFRGSDDPAQSPIVEREPCGIDRGSCLHFDECEGAAAPRDNVDLTAGHSGAAGENVPAFQAKEPAGEPLGPASAFLGGLPVHFDRSRARAYARLRGTFSFSATSAAAREGERRESASSNAAPRSSSLASTAKEGGPTTITISPFGAESR